MYSNYILGDDVLFYIRTVDGWLPVCALTDNPFQRDTGRIETTGKGSGGYRSYLPALHDYSISLNGVLTRKEGVVSWRHLDELQEKRVVFDWRILSSTGYISKTGTAFITNLTTNLAVRNWVTFGCTLSPATAGMRDILLWSQDGFNVVSQDGENMVEV